MALNSASKIQIFNRKYVIFSDLDLEGIFWIKLFQFKMHCSFILIKSNS